MTKKWRAFEMLLDTNDLDVNIQNAKGKGTLYGAIQQKLYNKYWVDKGYQPEKEMEMLFKKHGSRLNRYKA